MKKLEVYNLDWDGGTVYVIDGKVDNYIHTNDSHYAPDYYESLLKKLGVECKTYDVEKLPKEIAKMAEEYGYEDYDDE